MAGFVKTYVIFEIAHRYGAEMLLWDGWGATEHPLDHSTIDELARLLVLADAGDAVAETDLIQRFHDDEELRPSDQIVTYSPYGLPPRIVDLGNNNS